MKFQLSLNYLLLFILSTSNSFAQITIDTSLHHRFESAKYSLPKPLLTTLEEAKKSLDTLYLMEDRKIGEAYFCIVDVDTLNKAELNGPDWTNIKVIPTSPMPDETSNSDSIVHDEKRFKLTEGNLVNDTLFIEISDLFFERFRLEISRTSASAHFMEWYWEVPSLTFDPNGELLEELTVPVDLRKIELSSQNFTSDEVIYGYFEIETALPYFILDSTVGKQLLKLKKRFSAYFKVPINKSATIPVRRW